MVERGQIVTLASEDKSRTGVLVTLVRAEGSSYRKPGARMFALGAEY
jgi:xanthine/CO dehydrogenase XdhC/CoxF family maturation factor